MTTKTRKPTDERKLALRRGSALLLAGVALAGVLLAGSGLGSTPAPASLSGPRPLPDSLDYTATFAGGILGTKQVSVDLQDWGFSLSTAASVAGPTGGLASGRTSFHPVELSMAYDKSLTVPLAREEVAAGHFSWVSIQGAFYDVERGVSTTHLVLNISNVFVSNFTMTATAQELPHVGVELVYAQITMNTGQGDKSTPLAWDLTKNKTP